MKSPLELRAKHGGQMRFSWKSLRKSALWFVVVGIFNNFITYLAFALLVAIGIPPIWAITATYLLGTTISYLGNRNLSFKYKGNHLNPLYKIFITYFCVYVINAYIIYVLVDIDGISAYLVQLLSALPLAIVTFITLRYWVFKNKS